MMLLRKLRRQGQISCMMTNVLLSLAAVIGILLLCEAVLRVTHLFGARVSFATPDSVLGFRYVPGADYWNAQEAAHPIVGKINRFGWRDKDWSLQKPSGVSRVAVLGDSFVEAFQVESERTFLSLTEKALLEQKDIRAELMNFGRSGFTQTEELIVLEREVIRFRPDAVVVFFFPGNDIADVSPETASNSLRPFYCRSDDGSLVLNTRFTESAGYRIRRGLDGIKRHSAMLSLLGERSNAVSRKGEDLTLSQQLRQGYLSLCTNTPDAVFLRSYEMNERLLRAMAVFASSAKLPMLLVTLDNPAYRPEIEAQFREADPSFDPGCFENDMRLLAQSINIYHLGLQTVFRRAYQTDGKSLHWNGGHWNYAGHRIVAEALAQELAEVLRDRTTGIDGSRDNN
jgi:lysophospholipase L1-like esterase